MDIDYKGVLQWDKTYHKLMCKHKKPIFDSNSKHHGSIGSYYSYGNKANFGIVGKSSIAQYADKQSNRLSHYTGKCIEELSQMEIQYGIATLTNHISLLPKLISPIIQTAYDIQKIEGEIF